jgi:hypothetical protein
MASGRCSQPFIHDFKMACDSDDSDNAEAVDWHFALARINGYVVLVQSQFFSLSLLSSSTLTSLAVSNLAPESISQALTSMDVRVFRHEFITIFRFSHCDSLHPSDVHILEHIDDAATLYEEENDTVFLAKEVVQKITSADKRSEARRSLCW